MCLTPITSIRSHQTHQTTVGQATSKIFHETTKSSLYSKSKQKKKSPRLLTSENRVCFKYNLIVDTTAPSTFHSEKKKTKMHWLTCWWFLVIKENTSASYLKHKLFHTKLNKTSYIDKRTIMNHKSRQKIGNRNQQQKNEMKRKLCTKQSVFFLIVVKL